MRTSLLVAIALLGFGCGDDGNKAVDAPVAIDAAVTIDAAPPLALDCATYCSSIKTTCTGANAQYQDDAHCMAMCSKFTPGAQADTSGNTLGCHNWHIQNITVRANPADTHCSHAGPLGGKIDPTPDVHCGDPCTNFCDLEVATCGVMGTDATGQYASKAACVTACKGAGTPTTGFALTHPYKYDAGNPAGDSLACRMYHLTNAAASAAAATTHCPHTGPTPAAAGPCGTGTAATP